MKEEEMGQAVVHFEVVGKDGAKLQGYYAEMFGWKMNADNPMNYALVEPEDGSQGKESPAGSARAPRATRVTSPSTSRCLTWRRRWPRRRASAGPG
jgi:predicted enzyme related to lactoylglutathione lyase